MEYHIPYTFFFSVGMEDEIYEGATTLKTVHFFGPRK
jgi:hypothetical protein